MQLAPSNILSLFDTTKAERKSFVNVFIDELENGKVDPLQFLYNLKCMESVIKDIESNSIFKDALINEASKYGKSFEFNNSTMSIQEAGTKYDFSVCNDYHLTELEQQASELDKSIKERKEFLKSVPEGFTQYIEETGELVTLHRPAKSSTTIVKTILK